MKPDSGRSRSGATDLERTGATVFTAVWDRHRAEFMARVGAVDDAVRDGLAGRPDHIRRERGGRAAHMLAGSCGTFGFPLAGDIAGHLEEALEASNAPSHDEFVALSVLVAALRRALEGGVRETT